jgi:hypothetical protein
MALGQPGGCLVYGSKLLKCMRLSFCMNSCLLPAQTGAVVELGELAATCCLYLGPAGAAPHKPRRASRYILGSRSCSVFRLCWARSGLAEAVHYHHLCQKPPHHIWTASCCSCSDSQASYYGCICVSLKVKVNAYVGQTVDGAVSSVSVGQSM